MTLWRSGVIHFEAKCVPDAEDPDLWRFLCIEKTSSDRRLRLMIGTHYPYYRNAKRVDPLNLKRLAVFASLGLVPEYNNQKNKNTAIYPNIMCAKGSKVLYDMKPENKKKWQDILDMPRNQIEKRFNALPEIAKHLSGIPQLGLFEK